MTANPPAKDTGPFEFMLQLEQAYLACSGQAANVERIPRRIQTVRGLHRPRVLVYPTLAIPIALVPRD